MTPLYLLSIALLNFSLIVDAPQQQARQVAKSSNQSQVREKKLSRKEIKSKDDHYFTKDIAQGRDLSIYENGGAFHVGEYAIVIHVSPEEVANNELQVRRFVWEHWRSQKRGYLMTTYHGVDVANTSHYFIEPNDGGGWRIARRTLYLSALPGIKPELYDAPDAVIVECSECENEVVNKQSRLILKDKNGRKLYEL